MKTVIDLAKQPFYALREAISKVMRSVKAVVKRIKQTLVAIKRIVLSIRKCDRGRRIDHFVKQSQYKLFDLNLFFFFQ